MSEVIDITSRLTSIKENKNYNKHDYVLDACDEVFEYGAVVLSFAEDGVVELSSTVENEEDVVDMLVSAALSIKKRLNRDEEKDD
jgi:hypothetical protein